MSKNIKIILSIVLCLGLGFASGFISGTPLSEWYEQLNKPFFQPPPWLFGPAWTVLYILIGLAVGLIWSLEESLEKSSAMKLFIVQLILNLIWTPIFFALKQPLIALIVIVVLWFMIIATFRQFKKLNTTAAYLMLPYLLWVSFATVLNASIVYLN